MTIEINRPELEALILQRMGRGTCDSVEDVILQAFKPAAESAPDPEKLLKQNILLELCDPVRGLADEIVFARNPSSARSLGL